MSFDYKQWKEAQFKKEEGQTKVPFPLTITMAGMIWATLGVLHFVAVILGVGKGIYPGSKIYPSVMMGFVFLCGGLQVACGATLDGTMRGEGIGSIILGFIGICVALFSAKPLWVTAGIGVSLILAGFLAVIGETNYQKWREAYTGDWHPSKK